MCNDAHFDSTPIPTEGFGYKLFCYVLLSIKNDTPLTLCHDQHAYRTGADGWTHFDQPSLGVGFCFLLNRAEARRAKKYWPWPTVIRRIQYAGGVCKHTERYFVTGQTPVMALCKSFKILHQK